MFNYCFSKLRVFSEDCVLGGSRDGRRKDMWGWLWVAVGAGGLLLLCCLPATSAPP